MRWVSVRERVPDNNRDVWLWDGTIVQLGYFYDKMGWFDHVGDLTYAVTHWHEHIVPSPPQETL